MRQGITEEQIRLLTSWLGEFSVVQDYSWPLQDTNVLHVATRPGEEFIVKASTTSHHIHREIAAHAGGFEGLHGRVPALRFASAKAGILVTEFLPGILVEGTPAEDEPETYRQAGGAAGEDSPVRWGIVHLRKSPHGKDPGMDGPCPRAAAGDATRLL